MLVTDPLLQVFIQVLLMLALRLLDLEASTLVSMLT